MRAILVAVIVAWASSAAAQQTIVLDSWWNVDYAKEACRSALSFFQQERTLIAQIGCEAVTACPEVMPAVMACQMAFPAGDPTAEVRDFEDRVLSHMASDPRCKGIEIGRYSGPNSSNAAQNKVALESHWTLFLNFNPGATSQSWEILRQKPDTYMKGEDNPQDTARRVCVIVNGHGATVK